MSISLLSSAPTLYVLVLSCQIKSSFYVECVTVKYGSSRLFISCAFMLKFSFIVSEATMVLFFNDILYVVPLMVFSKYRESTHTAGDMLLLFASSNCKVVAVFI